MTLIFDDSMARLAQEAVEGAINADYCLNCGKIIDADKADPYVQGEPYCLSCLREAPSDTEQKLAFTRIGLDDLVTSIHSLDTAHEFIGQEQVCRSILRAAIALCRAYHARWPERAKLLRDNVVDLRTIRRGA
jgi:hypothetical protein